MSDTASPPSSRESLVDDLAATLCELGLDQVYGVNTGISQDKRHRFVTFCRARSLDGEVRVYGPKFILVKWRTTNRSLPHEGEQVCRSMDEAKDFLIKTFGDGHAKVERIRALIRSKNVASLSARMIFRQVGATGGVVEIDGVQFHIDESCRIRDAGIKTDYSEKQSQLSHLKTDGDVSEWFKKLPKLNLGDFK